MPLATYTPMVMKLGCLTPDCGKIARIRGLCSGCYSRIQIMVKRKQTTWIEEEAAGTCLAPKPRSASFNRWDR